MKARLLAPLVVLALVACGAPSPVETTLAGPGTTEPAPAIQLSYSLEAGRTFTFEVDIDQTLEMDTTGDSDAMGEDELPGSLRLHTVGTGTVTYTVEDGDRAGTFRVTLSGDFSDLSVIGTMDGEPVDSGEIPEMAELGPVDFTFTVDENGNLVEDDPDLEGLMGGLFEGFSGIGDMASTQFPFFGPPLTDREVAVGESWSSSFDIPGLGGETYTTETTSTVTGTEMIDGTETFVIDSVARTPRIEFDMGELIKGMMEGFLQVGEPTDEEIAELTGIMNQIRFLMVLPPSQTESTFWFDNEAGLTRKAEFTSSGGMSFDVAAPDEEGEIMEFGLNLTVNQTMAYRLVGS